jgi:hypothetical protein
MAQTETGLYEALEALLKSADKPLTCIDLFDQQHIKELAHASTRVSDYLGHLWRRGKVTRTPAARSDNDNSRWAYSWRVAQPGERNSDDVRREHLQLVHDSASAKKLNKLDMQITYDDESVTIKLPSMTITIQHK